MAPRRKVKKQLSFPEKEAISWPEDVKYLIKMENNEFNICRDVAKVPTVCLHAGTCNRHNKCENVRNKTECNISDCNRCTNQKIIYDTFPALHLFNSAIHGYGVFCKTKIPGDKIVGVYTGYLTDANVYNEKYKYEQPAYGCDVMPSYTVDAENSGNHTRFVNHSCHPNCVLQYWVSRMKNYTVLTTIRPIQPYEELTFHYGPGYVTTLCSCGSSSRYCKGYFGQPPDNVKKWLQQKKEEKENSSKPKQEE